MATVLQAAHGRRLFTLLVDWQIGSLFEVPPFQLRHEVLQTRAILGPGQAQGFSPGERILPQGCHTALEPLFVPAPQSMRAVRNAGVCTGQETLPGAARA